MTPSELQALKAHLAARTRLEASAEMLLALVRAALDDDLIEDTMNGRDWAEAAREAIIVIEGGRPAFELAVALEREGRIE